MCHTDTLHKLFLFAGSAVEISAGSRVSDGAVSYSSEEISHKTRRQMYISAANSRKKRTEVQNVYQYDTLSFNDSHESFDTIDNEYYSTDTSITDEVIFHSVQLQTHTFILHSVSFMCIFSSSVCSFLIHIQQNLYLGKSSI